MKKKICHTYKKKINYNLKAWTLLVRLWRLYHLKFAKRFKLFFLYNIYLIDTKNKKILQWKNDSD